MDITKKNGSLFEVEGDYIYTSYYDVPQIGIPKPSKIHIQTGQIQQLEQKSFK